MNFGKILCGKGGFNDEFGFYARFLSVWVKIGEEIGVCGLR